jgi:hypothetical protein
MPFLKIDAVIATRGAGIVGCDDMRRDWDDMSPTAWNRFLG